MSNKRIYPITVGLEHQTEVALPSYEELNLFRQHIQSEKLGPEHQPYQAYKGQTLLYRLIFGGIGCLFLALCGLIYTKSIVWSHALFFHDGQFLKATFYTLCGALSSLAFWIAYQIRPEKEAIGALRQRSREILRKLYHDRMSQIGVKRFLPQGKESKEIAVLKDGFHHAIDRVEHAVAVTSQLVLLIGSSSIVSPDMRIKLFNQALLELQDKLHIIVQNYS